MDTHDKFQAAQKIVKEIYASMTDEDGVINYARAAGSLEAKFILAFSGLSQENCEMIQKSHLSNFSAKS